MNKAKTLQPSTAEPPEHLDSEARAKWGELWPSLAERGEVDQAAADGLAAYCQAWSRWTAAEAKVNELGTVVKSPAGIAVPNPYLAVAKDAQRQMRQWAAELKLTPKAKGKAGPSTPAPAAAPATANTLRKLRLRK